MEPIEDFQKPCSVLLLKRSLQTFSAFDLLGFPKDILNILFSTNNSIIQLILDNVKDVDKSEYEKLKQSTLAAIDILREQIKNHGL